MEMKAFWYQDECFSKQNFQNELAGRDFGVACQVRKMGRQGQVRERKNENVECACDT